MPIPIKFISCPLKALWRRQKRSFVAAQKARKETDYDLNLGGNLFLALNKY